jgi:hypothetical protein
MIAGHKIVSGTTDTGRRWAQFWDLTKLGTRVSDECVAWMSSAPSGGPQFAVSLGCRPELIGEVLEAWAVFRAGGLPSPTHVLKWELGKPEFTPVNTDVLTNV